MKHPFAYKSTVEKGLLGLVRTLRSPMFTEWSHDMTIREYEHRKAIPEAKVVDCLKAWIDGQYAPLEENVRLWQELLKAIKEVDESALARIEAMQEMYDRKHGRIKNATTEKTTS